MLVNLAKAAKVRPDNCSALVGIGWGLVVSSQVVFERERRAGSPLLLLLQFPTGGLGGWWL